MKLLILVTFIKFIISNPSYDVDIDLPLREQYYYIVNHIKEVTTLVRGTMNFFESHPHLIEHFDQQYDNILRNQTNECDRVKIIPEL
jgi:hypothetical protein